MSLRDLILSDKNKFENTLSRLSLKARAAGIVVIYSTRKNKFNLRNGKGICLTVFVLM